MKNNTTCKCGSPATKKCDGCGTNLCDKCWSRLPLVHLGKKMTETGAYGILPLCEDCIKRYDGKPLIPYYDY